MILSTYIKQEKYKQRKHVISPTLVCCLYVMHQPSPQCMIIVQNRYVWWSRHGLHLSDRVRYKLVRNLYQSIVL